MGTDAIDVPSSAGDDDRILLRGEFASRSLERSYRRQQSTHDRRLLLACGVSMAIGLLLFVLSDHHLYGCGPPFQILMGVRLLYLVATPVAWAALRRCSTFAAADLLLLAWCLFTAAIVLVIHSTRPPSYTGHAINSLLLVLLTYCAVPLPVVYQALVAVPFSLAAVGAIVLSGVPNDGLTVRVLTTTFAAANVLGLFASWQLNRRSRQMYRAARRETVLRSRLEQALAEVRTLRGLLPICAWCKQVRDEEDVWQRVEDYVRDRTHAEFTHCICPTCTRKLLVQHGADPSPATRIASP